MGEIERERVNTPVLRMGDQPDLVSGLSTSREEGVAWIRLTHPPKNLLNPQVMKALTRALEQADSDPAVRAVVLTGDGDVFCGGLDVGAIQAGADPVEFAEALVELLQLLPELGTPIVCAANGDALASGFSIVCASDLTVAVEGAKLGTFEASIGIWPMIAQVPPLQRLLPRHALRNIISGVPFSTEEAVRIGAINEAVPADELESTARAYVELAVRAGDALPAGRRSFYRFLDMSYRDALDAALQEFTKMFKGGSSS